MVLRRFDEPNKRDCDFAGKDFLVTVAFAGT
jgi:hypothetical protein